MEWPDDEYDPERGEWMRFFAGWVPTGSYFRTVILDDIRKIAEAVRDPDVPHDRLSELCFVGVVSYFEGFFKDHLASLINIVPQLAEGLTKGGEPVALDAKTLVEGLDELRFTLGFYVAEKLDLGTPADVNARYRELVGIAPFTKDQARRYSGILRDRNQLVHHGGTVTARYLRQIGADEHERARRFTDSLKITKSDVSELLDFAVDIADKTVNASKAAVQRIVAERNVVLSPLRTEALDRLDF